MGAFELTAVGQLAAFAAASGLLIALFLQPQRGRADSMFGLSCALLAAWSLAALVPSIRETSLVSPMDVRTSMMLTFAACTVFAYFLFIARAIKTENRLVSLLTLALPLVFVVMLVVVWSGSAFAQTGWLTLGYGLLLTLLIYSAALFWAIMTSRETVAPSLRLAGVLLVMTAAALVIAPAVLESVGVVLAALTVLQTGWVTIRRQIMQPLKDLGDELRLANRELRQAVEAVGTERQKNRALTEEMRSMNAFRSDFLETLGHRLRTPLNAISGYNQLLQSGLFGELNDVQLDRLGTIARNSQQLLELINDMLDLNTLDAGRLELNLQPLALGALIRRICQELEPQRASKRLEQIVAVPDDLALVLADERRICQILTELMSNAIKFTDEGQVTVRAFNVRVQAGTSAEFALPARGWLSDGEWVITSVEDTGIGIAPEDQGKLFEAFFQLDGGQTAENTGSGLGLAISKRLVEQHDGVIWVRSIPKQGAAFLFALRAYRSVSVPASQMQFMDKEVLV
ncbi:MAG: HAMP domain-containing histidine kinase [Anaerolinea sp.]|nr:HAMP domain-containing histidine kinase [Anaerolinea sp.]